VTIALWTRVNRLEEQLRWYQRSRGRTGELFQEFDKVEESPLEVIFDESPPAKRDPFAAAITPRTREAVSPPPPARQPERHAPATPPFKAPPKSSVSPAPPARSERPVSVPPASPPEQDLWDEEDAEPAETAPAFNFEE